jgi:hypothetical protein
MDHLAASGDVVESTFRRATSMACPHDHEFRIPLGKDLRAPAVTLQEYFSVASPGPRHFRHSCPVSGRNEPIDHWIIWRVRVFILGFLMDEASFWIISRTTLWKPPANVLFTSFG